MPSGSWVKCGARSLKPNKVNYFVCYKAKGHHLKNGRDNRRHCDFKSVPAYYWETLPCEHEGCLETDTKLRGDEFTYCDEHWDAILESQASLARKGIY